ncbi:hypothetical protein LCGC14_1894030 [marine sediment metagenome]|uniref:Uncharacterized protein n=1 Tax=marine sediment metagenome TaxID=412755 RepID=A0A0F9FYL2_9ZZZZ
MFQTDVSPLQLHKLRALPSGMTESDHLSQAYLTEPERMDAVLAYAFGTQNETVLSMLTGGIGNTRFVSNREYTWDLHGQTERAVVVTGPMQSGNAGLNAHPFGWKMEEGIFEVSDNLVSDDGTMCRVSAVSFNGIDYIYTAVLTDPDPKKFINASQLLAGARFSKDFSTVEEFSDKGGGTNFVAPMTLKNQLTTLRKHYAVSRSAATDVMVIELFSEDGQSTKLWTKLAEWTALAQWYKEIDRSFIYTIYNKDPQGVVRLQGKNQRPVYHGAGIRQQISPANKFYYAKLTYDAIDEFLLDLSYNADRWGGNYNFIALTGKMGVREFNRAVIARQNELGVTITNSGTFITGTGDSLTLTGHFKKVEFLNGVSLTVKEFSPYDDKVRNRTLHPVSKKPIESYRFTLLNFGTVKGKANIRKVAKKNSENAMWHVCGSTTPYGDVAKNIGTMRSSGLDGYEVHMLAEVGIQLQDPTSCGEMIMRLN